MLVVLILLLLVLSVPLSSASRASSRHAASGERKWWTRCKNSMPNYKLFSSRWSLWQHHHEFFLNNFLSLSKEKAAEVDPDEFLEHSDAAGDEQMKTHLSRNRISQILRDAPCSCAFLLSQASGLSRTNLGLCQIWILPD